MPGECPPAAHAVFAHPQSMVNLTSPGARLRSTEDPGAWTELRHCLICASTFILHGRGASRRWLYSVAGPGEQAPTMLPVLEDVAQHCASQGLTASAVTRYLDAQGEEQALTTGERFWLEDAIRRCTP